MKIANVIVAFLSSTLADEILANTPSIEIDV
jgi:hypothetical protein